MSVFIAVLHWPATDRYGNRIITSFTTLDLHDIARPAKTYGVETYYIAHPVDAQREVIQRQIEYWTSEENKDKQFTRYESVALVKLVYNYEEIIEDILANKGKKPITVGTDARTYPNTISYKELSEAIKSNENDYLILFGTGYGIPKSLMETFDLILEPVYGASDWNHLSVRNAAAIILDRLLSRNRC
jgi:hypothetical protein